MPQVQEHLQEQKLLERALFPEMRKDHHHQMHPVPVRVHEELANEEAHVYEAQRSSKKDYINNFITLLILVSKHYACLRSVTSLAITTDYFSGPPLKRKTRSIEKSVLKHFRTPNGCLKFVKENVLRCPFKDCSYVGKKDAHLKLHISNGHRKNWGAFFKPSD